MEGKPDPDIPIYIASLGPQNLRLTGELADGWKGASFMPDHADIFFDHIRQGAEDAGRSFEDIDLQAGGSIYFTDEVDDAVEAFKPGLAFTLGAMGSRQFNFYNAAYQRAGYSDIAKEVQRLWVEGNRDEARKLVPDELVLKSNLIGTDEMIKDRIRTHRKAGITTLSVNIHRYRGYRPSASRPSSSKRIETLGRFMDLVAEVDKEPAPARS